MNEQLFYSQLEWVIGVGLFALLFAAAELGFRVALRRKDQLGEAAKGQTSTLQGAVLGLMGLLAGFCLSMAVSRFDLRKQIIIDEANAIGTCYLRTSLLPHPHSGKCERMVRTYLDERIKFSQLVTRGPQLQETLRSARGLQSRLWQEAVAANDVSPTVATGLFIQSLNDMIDIEATRMRSVENHVPIAVLVLLVLSAVASAVLIGDVSGQTGQRSRFATLTILALFALVILIIIDLDRPRVGLVRLSFQSLVELRDGLPPAPSR
ncbi:MAG TPA: hypothetical protein VM165_24210 [Planctomycetaceae bacterium]|nr:hypothetical protein [Planctomycetaceae bacterium]